MVRIRDVEPKYGYRILVELESGSVIYLNMTEKLETMRFNELKDEFLFQDVYTDGDSIIWANGRITLSLSEVFAMTRVDVEQNQNSETKAI